MAYKFYMFWWQCRDAMHCVCTDRDPHHMMGAIIRLYGIAWCDYSAFVRLGSVDSFNLRYILQTP